MNGMSVAVKVGQKTKEVADRKMKGWTEAKNGHTQQRDRSKNVSHVLMMRLSGKRGRQGIETDAGKEKGKALERIHYVLIVERGVPE